MQSADESDCFQGMRGVPKKQYVHIINETQQTLNNLVLIMLVLHIYSRGRPTV